jgi:hypothetical protein
MSKAAFMSLLFPCSTAFALCTYRLPLTTAPVPGVYGQPAAPAARPAAGRPLLHSRPRAALPQGCQEICPGTHFILIRALFLFLALSFLIWV